MLKPVYEYLKLYFPSTGNIFSDLIISAIFFTILNEFAYKTVGQFYRAGIIDGKASGSMMNFSIKIIIILLLIAILLIINKVKLLLQWII